MKSPLKASQVKWIEEDLADRGLHYEPLREDLLDHICIRVEALMEEGEDFPTAYAKALQDFPTGVGRIEKRTRNHLHPMTLIRSYFTVAFRNLWRHKWHSTINLLGLTVGMSACLLIFVFIRFELSYDKQHPVKNLYRLFSTIEQGNGEVIHTAFSGAPWGPAMVEEFPEIKDMARFMKYRLDVSVAVKSTQEQFLESAWMWGDQSALELFDLPLLQGDRKTALNNPNTVVISEATAQKYFGSEAPLGQVISYNNEVDLIVTGVMANMPENVHFKADVIASFNTLDSFWSIIDNWSILYYYTYFELTPGADIDKLEADFPKFFQSHIGADWVERRSASLQKVADIHLSSNLSSELKLNARQEDLLVLLSVAIILLFLACSNFINLNLARSLTRVREVGIRKVMGGLRIDLVFQFVIESTVLVSAAMLLALVLAESVLPALNDLLGLPLRLLQGNDPYLWLFVLLSFLFLSGASGILPAWSAARTKTVIALKGKWQHKVSRWSVRDTLLFFQFAICTALAIAIVTIQEQQDYLKNKDLGFEQEQLLMLSTTGMATADLDLVKESLQEIPAVESVTITSHKLVGDQPYHANYAFTQPNKGTDTLSLGRLHIDHDFLTTYGVKLLNGRDLNASISSDTAAFLINETTARSLGLSVDADLTGVRIDYLTQGEEGRYPRSGPVVGIVEDFHFESLHHAIEGFVMDIQLPRSHFIACRVVGNEANEISSLVSERVKDVLPELEPEPFWLDAQLTSLYRAEQKLGRLIGIGTAIALCLAMTGLLGLVFQIAAAKRREVGVRKVLGAKVAGILLLFSGQFMRHIVLSFLLTWPLAYYWMQQWLDNFSYRISISLTVFLLCSAGVLLLAIVVISLSSLRTARMNPADSLRYD